MSTDTPGKPKRLRKFGIAVLAGVVTLLAIEIGFRIYCRLTSEPYSSARADARLDELMEESRGLQFVPDAALYWAARLIEGGEDPMVIFRRSIAMAAEDVGLADPQALMIAVAARDAFHMLGPPEGYLPMAEMLVYLATAPKSNRVKEALGAAFEAARRTAGAAVPMHVRNAPTQLMKDLGHGADYKYAHDSETGYVAQEYLPHELRGTRIYQPGPFGFEKEIAKRLEWWAKQRGAGTSE